MLVKCPECGSEKLMKKGMRFVARIKRQQYQCSACGKVFVPKEGSDDG